MKVIILILFLISPINIYSKSISGKIVNEEKDAIAYAKVGIVNTSSGSLTNKKGEFSFEYEGSDNDSIKVFMIGYYPKTYPLSKIPPVIELERKKYRLNEVVVKPKDLRSDWFGYYPKSKTSLISFASTKPGNELGSVIDVPNGSKIEKVRIYIAANGIDNFKLRLNVYDHNDSPKDNLLKDPVYLEIKKGVNKIIEIDLSEFNIICNDEIFVSLELLEELTRVRGNTFSIGSSVAYDDVDLNDLDSSMTMYAGISDVLTNSTPCYMREASLSEWQEMSLGLFSLKIPIRVMVTYED